MKMFALYNLSKDLIRKEEYFEIGSILEDLFQISYEHEFIEHKFADKTIFHKFFHDHVKEENVNSTRYEYLGEVHRLNGPAIIRYDKDGNVIEENYCLNSELHREGKPAIIEYDKDGNVIKEEYWLNHKYHREDGPAIIEYDEDGNIIFEEYYLHGEEQILD